MTRYYDDLTYGNRGTPFTQARLKIKRAERHLEELRSTARELPKRRGYYMAIGKPEPRKLEFIYIPENYMPMEFGAVLGDAIHNIRAAFDYVAIVISCPPYGSGNPKKVYFPTGVDREAFIEARDGKLDPNTGRRSKGKMEGAGTDAVRIVEDLEPYHGGKYSIRALHDLDIIDKHKLIVPALSLLHVDEWDFILDGKLFSLTGADFQPNADRSNFVASVDCQGLDTEKFNRGYKFNASFEITFGKAQPFEGKPIIPTLLKFCDVAKGFIETCERFFIV